MGRLVILSGPSCVGKSPLNKALKIFYASLAGKLQQLVLYNSRLPRPGEVDGVDYYFRTREYIEQLRGMDHFLVVNVRGDLQALDLKYLKNMLTQSDAIFEGNPFIGVELLEMARSQKMECVNTFLSPLSSAEIEELKGYKNFSLETFVTDVMRRKLLKRTQKQKSILSLGDLEDIEVRAKSAYAEMKRAWRFDFVIPNHDGEDSDNWTAFYYPIGDARIALNCFAQILSGRKSDHTEKWHQELLP